MMAGNVFSPVRLLYAIMFTLPPSGMFRHSIYFKLSQAYYEKIIYVFVSELK